MKFEAKNPAYKQVIMDKLAKNHFSQHIGYQMTLVSPGHVEGEIDVKEMHLQQNGFLHGGVTSTLADIVMGFAAYTLVPQGQGMVTSDLKVAYLRPGTGKKILAKGRVIKAGNLLYYCEADIISVNLDGSEELIARGYSTMCAVQLKVEN